MRRFGVLIIAVLLLGALSCGPKGSEKPEFDIAGEFTHLSKARTDIEAMRKQMADLDAKIQLLEDVKARKKRVPKDQLPEEDLATLQMQKSELKSKLDDAVSTFMDNLTVFLTKGLNDFPDAPETKKAVRMYSDENIRVADEFITRGGNYKKAIEIYQQALQYDTSYETLLDKLKEAQDLHFIIKERYDKVKKGMSMDQVRALCGYPNIRFIKEYKERGKHIIAWFYPRKDAQAAGFYFYRGKLYNKRWQATKN